MRLHHHPCSYLPTTKDTINAQTLALCKDGVKILNYARGELVNTAALLEAMETGKVSGYMTDFPTEAILASPASSAPRIWVLPRRRPRTTVPQWPCRRSAITSRTATSPTR